MFRSNARWARVSQVALSLGIGLALWEFVGWQFTAAYMAPVLGSDVGIVASIAEAVAGAGHTVMPAGGLAEARPHDHPGTLPRLLDFIREGEFFIALGQSLALFGTGFSIAVLIGLPLGIAMARLRLLRIGLESYVLALYVTPMAALIPFILAIFGFQFWPKVLVVVLFSVFPMLYNTLEGARSIKPELIEVARSFRSGEWALWRDVLIPYTFPFALTGIRQAVGRALVGMVASEIFLNNTGLGGWLVDSSRSFDMAGVLGAILVITVLGITLMALVRRVEVRFASWRGLSR